jgi:hypothetical protein
MEISSLFEINLIVKRGSFNYQFGFRHATTVPAPDVLQPFAV